MPACKFCNQDNLEWYQDHQDKWKLGIKIDINNYRKHICKTKEETPNNKRNWIEFICEKCGNKTRQNVKLIKPKTINLCYDCDNSC
jgi:hypothetical protein